ncbi:MAG: leucine-rich repeat domain-containing protein [Alistipes sp.]|nr:leucine-rich repeat domain-containing protein [Alistipes sp.]
MKKLFLLLALVGMVATACEDDGVNEPTNTPTETPDGGNDEKPDDGNDEMPDGGNDEKPDDNTPEDKTQPIKFFDNAVKTLCVVSWDTNGDAELSYEEAAAVTDLGTTFKRSAVISFTELEYFTGLSYIAIEAFWGCESLKKIELPHNITSIGEAAFYWCDKLTSVTIPDSVTSIGEWAFFNCSSLTSFYGKFASEDNRCLIVDGKLIAFAPAGLIEYTIPDSVTKIGEIAFYYCTSLTSVTIPDSVTSIGKWAFAVCSSLTSVYCKPTTKPAGGSCMFYSNALGREIYVPAASVEAYKSAAYWSDYASDIVGYEF